MTGRGESVNVEAVQNDPVLEEMLLSIKKIMEDSSPRYDSQKSGHHDSLPMSYATKSHSSVLPDLNSLHLSQNTSDFSLSDSQIKNDNFCSSDSKNLSAVPLQNKDLLSSFSHQENAFQNPANDFDLSLKNLATELEKKLCLEIDVQKECEPIIQNYTSSLEHYEEKESFNDTNPVLVTASSQPFEDFSSRFSDFSDSLEATTLQILRPMLQDWMDNNLHLLVEKLIREEMDRVVRGGEASA